MDRCKIFIVEDEIIVRQALRYIIEAHKDRYEIVGEASNGQEACELIADVKPNIVITDIMMPVMNGVELVKFLKINYPDIYTIVLSGYNDFEYVKTCFKYGVFEYLLKPKLNPENLCVILNKICERLGCGIVETNDSPAYFLTTITESTEVRNDLQIPDKFKEVHIGILGFNIKKIIGYEKNRSAIYVEIISEKIMEFFDGLDYEFYKTSKGVLLAIIVYESKKNQEFQREVDIFASKIADEILGVKVCYSSICRDDSLLSREIFNMSKSVRLQFFVSNATYCYKAIQVESQKIYLYKEYMEKIDFIEKSLSYLQDELHKITYEAGYRESELKKQLEHIIYSTFNHLQEKKLLKQDAQVDAIPMMDLISDMYSLEDVQRLISDFAKQLQCNLDDTQSATDTFLIKLIEYIRDNYAEQLNLKQVAEEFHMSYSYLSTYFSYNLGMGFNEYLNNLRIEKAKDMLMNSDLTINEICESVGYLNQSYFSKVFRKNTGVSPTSYRRKG